MPGALWTACVSPHLNRALLALDQTLFDHSSRVLHLAIRLGKTLGLNDHDLAILSISAQLHDVGKIAIPGEILNCPGRLADAEMAIMKTHSEHGERFIRCERDIPFCDEVAGIVRHHHERWDGSGYPDGLSGQEIPLLSRIIAVADSWDAMSSWRAYHPGRKPDEVLRILISERGSKHDPVAIDAFIEDVLPSHLDSWKTRQNASA